MELNGLPVDPAAALLARCVPADAAVRRVKPGQRVFVGTGCATPRALVRALEALASPPADVVLVHFLTNGALALDGAQAVSRYRHQTFFVGSDFVGTVEAGTTDYIPISIAEVPALLDTGRLDCDVAFIQVTPPDRWGYVSLGVSVDLTLAMVRHARLVIAEVNPNMPRTVGQTTLHHRMDEDDVYTRFFRRLKSLSFNEAQRLCNTNYSTEVAFMAVAGPREDEEVVASGCYFVNPTSNLAEVGYMVGRAWQGSGLGKVLQERLKEFALKSGLRGFEAEILKENARMVGLARQASRNVTVRDDDDCLHVTMLF